MTTLTQPRQQQFLPPPGAFIHPDSTVSFTLYAPGKSRVAVLGDFNDFDPEADPMEQIADGLWSVRKAFPPGYYSYQFIVDGQIIGDPYATRVKYPQHGKPPFCIVNVGNGSFRWRHDQWERPAYKDLVIYELHVGDFTPQGTFAAVEEKLGYLQSLGVNAIEIMPVTDPGTGPHWGYEPCYHFAVNHRFGTPADLKSLVDQAHAHGIAVLLDLVFSHAGRDHPFFLLYDYDQSPWFGPEGIGGPNVTALPTFDHRKDPTRAFVRDVQHYWLREFHIDGFRYDYTFNLGIDGEYGLPWLVKTAREVRDDAYLIAEHLPEEPQRVMPTGVDGAWHIGSSWGLTALILRNEYRGYRYEDFRQTLNIIDPLLSGYPTGSSMVNYIASHDESHLLSELIYCGMSEHDARHRLAFAVTILLTAPGVPMLYHGQEFGETSACRNNDYNPTRWHFLQTEGGRGLFEHCRRMAALRRDRPAFRAPGFKFEEIHDEQKWAVYHRWDENGDAAIVAANFADGPRNVRVPFPTRGAWQEFFTDRRVEDADHAECELQPAEAAIWIKV